MLLLFKKIANLRHKILDKKFRFLNKGAKAIGKEVLFDIQEKTC